MDMHLSCCPSTGAETSCHNRFPWTIMAFEIDSNEFLKPAHTPFESLWFENLAEKLGLGLCIWGKRFGCWSRTEGNTGIGEGDSEVGQCRDLISRSKSFDKMMEGFWCGIDCVGVNARLCFET